MHGFRDYELLLQVGHDVIVIPPPGGSSGNFSWWFLKKRSWLLHDLIDTYNNTFSAHHDKHAPLKTKTIRTKTFNPWFTPALSKLKSARRHLEKVWLWTRSLQDLQPLRTATNAYHSSLIHAKRLFNSLLISSSSNLRKLWNTINKLLHRKPISQLPSSIDFKSLPSMFANLFSNKILKLHSTIKSNSTNTSPHFQRRHIPPNLTVFTPISREELSKLIAQSSNTFCDLDPIPTFILKQCPPSLLPTITDIVNLSLTTGIFPKQFKLFSVIPLLKKYNLDKGDLSNYRPISLLSFLSKLTEWVVKQRLTHHLSSNHLLNSFQSAYTHSSPFHWIHASFCSWPHHQGHGSIKTHCSLSP